jgi:hypothetical protein
MATSSTFDQPMKHVGRHSNSWKGNGLQQEFSQNRNAGKRRVSTNFRKRHLRKDHSSLQKNSHSEKRFAKWEEAKKSNTRQARHRAAEIVFEIVSP